MSRALTILKRYYREIFIVSLILFIFMRGCGGNTTVVKPPNVIKIESIGYHPSLVNETAPVIKFVGKTKTVSVVKTVRDTVFITKEGNIDSAKIVDDWLKVRVYVDTILNSKKKGKIIITDSVSRNRILSRSSIVDIKPIEIVKRHGAVIAGIGAGGWTNKFGISLNLGYQMKRGSIIAFGYDPINKVADVRGYFRISFRKKNK